MIRLLVLALMLLLPIGCRAAGAHGEPVVQQAAATISLVQKGIDPSATMVQENAIPLAAPDTPTPVATTAATATPTATMTPRPSPSPTPLAACSERHPPDEELLVLVNRDFGLAREYRPADLVPLADYFPVTVTLGYPTEVRERIIGPLTRLLEAAQIAGLSPVIISGFRDYAAQSIAREKWIEQYPDWATNLSAPPGHSEHQLGTTVDFGSPELPELVGEENIQFHPAFSRTPEGEWLARHAGDYGFTMSYPADRIEETEFWYEPWHFRYVGEEAAAYLEKTELTISEYLLQIQGQPCIP